MLLRIAGALLLKDVRPSAIAASVLAYENWSPSCLIRKTGESDNSLSIVSHVDCHRGDEGINNRSLRDWPVTQYPARYPSESRVIFPPTNAHTSGYKEG